MRQTYSGTHEIQRTSHNGKALHSFDVEVTATVETGPASADDPGECRVSIDRATCGGEGFDLTTREESDLEQEIAESVLS